MSKTSSPLPNNPPSSHQENRIGFLGLPRSFYLGALLPLLIVFSFPLYQLGRFAWGSELYSHALLIPFVSCFLFWIKQPSNRSADTKRLSPLWGAGFALLGTAAFIGYLLKALPSSPSGTQDALALAAYSLVLLLIGASCWLLPISTLRALAFPLGFLVFMAPFPLAVEQHLETLLQHGSAWVAHVFFDIIGTPVFRDETLFQLPGFKMQVAPECSGIHSTIALFITSLVAGQVLLKSNRNRAIIAAVVLPIALLRNGLRVTVIGELCVRVGPHMIDSFIHHHGGPIFFALSLVPFSLILFFLLKIDRKKNA